MSFENPMAFLILLFYGVVAVVFSRRAWQQGQAIDYVEFALRTALIALLSAAIARPFFLSVKKTRTVQALVDVSDSVDLEVGEALYSRVRKLATDANLDLEVVPFAKQSAVEGISIGGLPSSYRALRQKFERLDVGGTNLERGFETLIGSSISGQEGRGAILLSDGWETEGNAGTQKSALTSARVRIYPIVPTQQSSAKRFRISNLYAPLVAPAQKSVDVRVSLENSSDANERGLLEILHDNKVIHREEVSVEAGRERVVTVQSDPSQEGIKEITARLTPVTKDFGPSAATIFLSAEEREKVLLLNGSADDARYLPEVLREQAYRLKSVIADSRMEPFGSLQDYDAVIFNNIALNQLPSGMAERVEQYVKDGGGFLMLGGNRGFGLGGYLHSAVEEILPVRLVPPQTMEKRLNIAVELVIDKSGSMGENQKLEFAKEAARQVIKSLKDDDLIGVIGFDSAPWIVVKLSPLSEVRDSALDRVGRLFPAQKTNLLPAIDEARRALVKAQAGRKHMLILTDGKVPDAGPFYVELTKQMRLLGVTVSTIMLGGEADIDMLKEMAEVGGGAFYQTLDASSLARIFLGDIKTASGERTLKEQQDFAVRNGPGELRSTTIRNFPTLRGYVQTRPREGANLELLSVAADKAEPLLASWAVGRGKSIAFTSDANGRWSSDWVAWERFARFFTELVDAIRPTQGSDRERVNFDLRHYVDHGALTLDLTVYSESAALSAKGALSLPNGSEQPVQFELVSRGHFKATVENATAGKYELRAMATGKKLTPVAFYLPGDLFGEKRDQGFNLPLLSELAGGSGGRVNPTPDELKGSVTARVDKREVTSYVLLLALGVLLAHILWREVWGRRRRRLPNRL